MYQKYQWVMEGLFPQKMSPMLGWEDTQCSLPRLERYADLYERIDGFSLILSVFFQVILEVLFVFRLKVTVTASQGKSDCDRQPRT
jgi:hypothetical protein